MKLQVAYFVDPRMPTIHGRPSDIYVVGRMPLERPPTLLEILLKRTYSLSAAECIHSDDLFDLRAVFPNYGDYGYGIFLLDDNSRDYVLKNIGLEKDDFLRTMMWGSLWDSVREGELDPKA